MLQCIIAIDIFCMYFASDNDYDYVISTDGSTLKEKNCALGQSAAAAVVFNKESMQHPVKMESQTIGHISHNYEAELTGIHLALKYLQENRISHSKVLIVCDCVPAIEATFNNNKITTDYNHVIMSNKDILFSCRAISINCESIYFVNSISRYVRCFESLLWYQLNELII